MKKKPKRRVQEVNQGVLFGDQAEDVTSHELAPTRAPTPVPEVDVASDSPPASPSTTGIPSHASRAVIDIAAVASGPRFTATSLRALIEAFRGIRERADTTGPSAAPDA